MLGREGSQKASKPCTLSWLVFVVLSKATPAQPCQEQAGLSCSSQRRAPLAPPPGKGCCAVNKEVSNAFWVSSSITFSFTTTTRSWNLYFEKCQPTPLLPDMTEAMHWKTMLGEAIPCMQFLSSPVFRHGETSCAALFTPPSRMSHICCVPFKSQLYQVLTIPVPLLALLPPACYLLSRQTCGAIL